MSTVLWIYQVLLFSFEIRRRLLLVFVGRWSYGSLDVYLYLLYYTVKMLLFFFAIIIIHTVEFKCLQQGSVSLMFQWEDKIRSSTVIQKTNVKIFRALIVETKIIFKYNNLHLTFCVSELKLYISHAVKWI